MEKEEGFRSRINSHGWLYSLLGLLLGLLTSIYLSWDTIGGLIARMSPDVFNIVVIVILFVGVIISYIRWNTQLLRNKLHNAEGNAKQYDNLVKQVELPKAVDKAITVEKNLDWGISHPYKDIIQNRRDDKFPYLQFYMQVINRTYYYFEPEELVICCRFDNHKLCDEWYSKVKTKETNIELDFLHECEDGTIRVVESRNYFVKKLHLNLW